MPPTIEVTESGCWLLRGHPTESYSRVSVGGVKVLGHLLFYRVLVGEVPKGKQLHHICENPPCVNPEHLEPLTPAEHKRRHNEGRTHCRNGHAVAEHGYRDSSGALRCRVCRQATVASTKARAAEAKRYRCRCGWAGSRPELVDLRCPSCSTRVGRWGPQLVDGS